MKKISRNQFGGRLKEGGEELCWYDIDEFNFHRFIDGLNAGFKAQVG